jgi:hypothetical protein
MKIADVRVPYMCTVTDQTVCIAPCGKMFCPYLATGGTLNGFINVVTGLLENYKESGLDAESILKGECNDRAGKG